MLVNATEMLLKARDGHYGVPQFNINNLEWTKAVLTACEQTKSPVILGVSEGAGKYMTGFKTVAAMVSAMVDSMGITVPVALHLDHGTYEGCKACVEAGFSSIMFDGSHYPIERPRSARSAALRTALSAPARSPTPPSAPASPSWASTSWRPASATSTASTPPTGRASTLRRWTASIRPPTTSPWCCTAAPASPTR